MNNSEVVNHTFESRSHNARGQAKSKWVIIWRRHTEIHLPNEAFRIITTTLSRSRCKSAIRAMAWCLPINVLVRGGLQRDFACETSISFGAWRPSVAGSEALWLHLGVESPSATSFTPPGPSLGSTRLQILLKIRINFPLLKLIPGAL